MSWTWPDYLEIDTTKDAFLIKHHIVPKTSDQTIFRGIKNLPSAKSIKG